MTLIPIIIPKIKPPIHAIMKITKTLKYSTGIETIPSNGNSFISEIGLSKDRKINSPNTPVNAIE